MSHVSQLTDLGSPDMDKPISLIETIDGKMQLNPTAIALFDNCDVPASVISILGSVFVLLNILFNKNIQFFILHGDLCLGLCHSMVSG